MKIGLIGAGRLGICFSLLCEQAGYNILVSDIRQDYVDGLNNRVIETNEPEVQELLNKAEMFEATTDNQRVVNESDIIYTLVATPSLPSGDYDVSAVWKVIDDIIDSGVKNKAFVVGCTTNPGDCAQFQEKLNELGWTVYYNPEFIAQGSIIKDLRHADMVLIGGKKDAIYDELHYLYHRIQVTEPKISLMSTTAAELVKLAVNCYLTTKISYANMVGEVMTLSGMSDEIDVVLDAIGSDTRVGNKYLRYGYGFGGPCLPRDNRSFGAYCRKLGINYNLGEVTDEFNEEHLQFLCNQFIAQNESKIPFYMPYVSYKRGSDILTESHQYKLCKELLQLGYKVYVGDNQAIVNQVKNDLVDGNIVFVNSKEEIIEEVFEIGL
jgi:nucleotide sugar dehydrogenase|tara:strand:- start:2222 stop:3361 length:1140 start_codon:yes stop_codon:yes gene_type:complete